MDTEDIIGTSQTADLSQRVSANKEAMATWLQLIDRANSAMSCSIFLTGVTLDWTCLQDLGRMRNLTVLSLHDCQLLDGTIELDTLCRRMAQQYQEAGHFSRLKCLRVQNKASAWSTAFLDHLLALPSLEMVLIVRPRVPYGTLRYRALPFQRHERRDRDSHLHPRACESIRQWDRKTV